MAENFNLIFGQNASQSYAWSDSDYQNGWQTVGDTPPTAQQFDALQRRADLKAQELNNALTPLVTANNKNNRKPSTTYADEDIQYSDDLPTGWFLECTVAGVTSAGALVVPSPVHVNDTITDGTVTWTVKKTGSGNGDGVPLGAILPLAHNSTLPAGYLLCDGRAVSRTMYPDLFAAIGTTYGAGDGSTTFNVPDYNAAERVCQGSTVAGTVKTAGLPNITGEYNNNVSRIGLVSSGALGGTQAPTAVSIEGTNTSYIGYNVVKFDASLSNPIYGASNTVQPPALTARYIIKAFDGQTADSALIDITQYANELANKADRSLSNLTQTGQDSFLERDFTIIYPNGGSEASPANVTTNSRYIESNPFLGYYVKCECEINYNGQWGNPYFMEITANSTSNYAGARATQFNDDIVIQTGASKLMGPSHNSGNPFDYDANLANYITTAPCRVKVWKIGKIPTAKRR